MNNRILLVVIISLCIVMSYAQNEPEKRNLVDSSCSLSKTTITFRYFDDKPIIVDSNDNLNRAVQILKQNPQLKIVVEGYANDYNSAQDNSDLAQRRANNVRKLFIDKGVDPSQIETASYTVNDLQNRQNITDPSRKEHDCAIFRIVKR